GAGAGAAAARGGVGRRRGGPGVRRPRGRARHRRPGPPDGPGGGPAAGADRRSGRPGGEQQRGRPPPGPGRAGTRQGRPRVSGDKLLGGAQSGIMVGRADLVERLRRQPRARALRVDKMTTAALGAVLKVYATGRRAELPIWRFLSASPTVVLARAKALASAF